MLREQWARTHEQAPPWVSDQLEQAHRLAHQHRVDARLGAAELATLRPDDERRPELVEHLERAERLAGHHDSRIEGLEAGREARAQWYRDTTADREAAGRAGVELDARNLPTDRATAAGTNPDSTIDPTDRDAREHETRDEVEPAATLHAVVDAKPAVDAQPVAQPDLEPEDEEAGRALRGKDAKEPDLEVAAEAEPDVDVRSEPVVEEPAVEETAELDVAELDDDEHNGGEHGELAAAADAVAQAAREAAVTRAERAGAEAERARQAEQAAAARETEALEADRARQAEPAAEQDRVAQLEHDVEPARAAEPELVIEATPEPWSPEPGEDY